MIKGRMLVKSCMSNCRNVTKLIVVLIMCTIVTWEARASSSSGLSGGVPCDLGELFGSETSYSQEDDQSSVLYEPVSKTPVEDLYPETGDSPAGGVLLEICLIGEQPQFVERDFVNDICYPLTMEEALGRVRSVNFDLRNFIDKEPHQIFGRLHTLYNQHHLGDEHTGELFNDASFRALSAIFRHISIFVVYNANDPNTVMPRLQEIDLMTDHFIATGNPGLVRITKGAFFATLNAYLSSAMFPLYVEEWKEMMVEKLEQKQGVDSTSSDALVRPLQRSFSLPNLREHALQLQ
jgi:hypothetical protein